MPTSHIQRAQSADSLPWQMPTNATAAVPLYWYRNPVKLSGGAGIHRFYWDVHYQNLPIPRIQPHIKNLSQRGVTGPCLR